MLAGFKKRLWIHITIAGSGIVLLTVFIIVLNYDINKRDRVITEQKQLLELRNQTIALLSNASNDVRRAQPMLASLETILPNKDQLINFPTELAKTARGYGVEIGFTFGPETASTPEEPGNIKFTMTLVGPFSDIVDFMKAFEQHRYFIKLDSIDVRPAGKDGFSLLTGGVIYTK